MAQTLNAVFPQKAVELPFATRLVKHNLDMLDATKAGWYYALAGNVIKAKPFGTDAFYLQVTTQGETVIQTLYSANLLPNCIFIRRLVNGEVAEDWIHNDDDSFQFDMTTVRRADALEVTLKSNNETYTFKIDINEASDIPTDLPIHFEMLESLPLTGRPNILYFVKEESIENNNAYGEYAWINDEWEKVGYYKPDLSGYWNKEEITPVTNEEMDDLFAEVKAKQKAKS